MQRTSLSLGRHAATSSPTRVTMIARGASSASSQSSASSHSSPLSASSSPPTAHERDLTVAITSSAWEVLYALRARGHESYVVGGTVRDYLLGAKTKDVDVCTSASPEQVKGLFPRSRVLGRRFPIVHVRQGREIIEVSSFRTGCDERDAAAIPLDWYQQQQRAAHQGGRLRGRGDRRYRKDIRDSVLADWDEREATTDWSAARRQNSLKRDFTINGMLYEPFSRVLFDYVGGVQDCERGLLRTIVPPDGSFETDPARILRAVRLKARLGLEIEEETRAAMRRHIEAGRIVDLNHGRLQMELGTMFAYGSAEATYKALEEFDLLSALLPHHARLLQPREAGFQSRPMAVLRLMDDCVKSMRQPLASIAYNGALFTMLVLAELDSGAGGRLASIDVVDECFERMTAPKQVPKQLLARRALEQTSYLLREQLLLKERGGSGIGERRPGRRAGRGKAKDRPTATSLLEDIIARAFVP